MAVREHFRFRLERENTVQLWETEKERILKNAKLRLVHLNLKHTNEIKFCYKLLKHRWKLNLSFPSSLWDLVTTFGKNWEFHKLFASLFRRIDELEKECEKLKKERDTAKRKVTVSTHVILLRTIFISFCFYSCSAQFNEMSLK